MGDRIETQRKLNGRSTDSSQSIFTPVTQNSELSTIAKPELSFEIQRSTDQTSEPTSQTAQPQFIGHDFSRISLLPHLSVSQPDEPVEPRSNRVSRVMRSATAGNVYSSAKQLSGHDFSQVSVLPQAQPAISLFPPEIQRKCAACEEDEQLMRQVNSTVVQREEADTSSAPAAQGTTEPSSESDPQIQAIAQQLEQQLDQQLIPETIQAAFGQIDFSGMPTSDDATSASDSPSPNVYTKRATSATRILRQSSPQQPDPPSTAGSSSATPSTGSAGKVVSALAAVPEIKSGLATLQTLTIGRFAQDWSRLSTGEQIGFVSTSVVIGLGTVLPNLEARRFVLDQLNGQVLPVPGVKGFHLEINTSGNNLMLGMHLDIGRFLPPVFGFGPSSPSAIGGPPQPQPSPIQRQENGDAMEVGDAIADRIQAKSGSGSKLNEGVQQHLEQHLGADLSRVRIHTDSEADRLSRSVNAIAFTTGQDIFFSSGSYNPTSSEGQHLIAHEVVHTVQQANGAVASTLTAGGVSISDPGDAFEQEAEQIADQVNTLSSQSSRTNHQPSQAKTVEPHKRQTRIQRKFYDSLPLTIQCKKENETSLAAIQGYAMFNLLPRLQALPEDVRNDEEAGRFVGGPRLVTAMRAVRAQGKPWLDFAAAHNGELAALPSDQIADIISFLGASQDARYFKSDEFDGRFDGAVDPTLGVVTLFFRVRFETVGSPFGMTSPGTPEWEKQAAAGRQQFEVKFKQVVEETWSNKGTIRPACPIGLIKTLQTKVVVTVVESGEHKLVYIHRDQQDQGGRSNEDNLQASDNQPKQKTKQVVDSTGHHPEQVTYTQIPSTHEFGHALGLEHSRCPGNDDNCYGVTAEERRDIMGGGDKLQVIKRGGKILHDDFQPFERIAERWGKDVFPGALARCNKWSAG